MALDVQANPRLAHLTTLRLGGRAMALAVARDERDLDELSALVERERGEPFALGRGSNLLAADYDLPLVLVAVKAAGEPTLVSEDGRRVVLRVGAGLAMPGLLRRLKQAGLSGLERLAGIPGSFGGAVAMNAGSYGVEIGRRLARIRLWTPARGAFWVAAADCAFGYRRFDPRLGPGFRLVLGAEIELERSSPDAVGGIMAETYAKKKQTQPVTAKSAGCVFKNPPGESAGRLLDLAGFRGRRLGGMGFSELHANFLVNLGRGTSAEALELLALARAGVRERFGLDLETEVVILQ